jgi:hypothetical protein
MPNHYHLLVRDPDGAVSEFMRLLGITYTRHANDRAGRDGPLFRGRFHSVAVEDDAQLLRALRYVHRNPLAIVAAGELDAYRWSSHRTYIGHRRAPGWLALEPLRRRLGSTSEYLGFINRSTSVESLCADLPRLVELRSIECDLDGRALETLVRMVVVVLIDRHPDLVALLEPLLGGLSPGSLRNLRSHVRREVRDDPDVRRLVDLIDAELGASSTGSDPVDDGQVARSSPARSWAA